MCTTHIGYNVFSITWLPPSLELLYGIRTHLTGVCLHLLSLHIWYIVLRTGLEPVSFHVKGGCPNQLDERSSCADGRIRTSSYLFIVTNYNGQPLFLLSPYVMEFPHYHIVSWSPAFNNYQYFKEHYKDTKLFSYFKTILKIYFGV